MLWLGECDRWYLGWVYAYIAVMLGELCVVYILLCVVYMVSLPLRVCDCGFHLR